LDLVEHCHANYTVVELLLVILINKISLRRSTKLVQCVPYDTVPYSFSNKKYSNVYYVINVNFFFLCRILKLQIFVNRSDLFEEVYSRIIGPRKMSQTFIRVK